MSSHTQASISRPIILWLRTAASTSPSNGLQTTHNTPWEGLSCRKRKSSARVDRIPHRLTTAFSYLIADYERNNFSISQAVFQDGAQEKLIAIPSINGSTSTNTTGPMHVVGPGGIAGIIVGFLALSLVGLSVFAFFTHRWPFKPLPLPKDDAAVDEKAGIKVEMAGHSFGELPGSKVASEFPSPSNGSKTDLTSTHSEMEARHKIELPGHNHVPEMHGNRSSPLAKPPTELADSSIYQELPGDPVPPNYHNNFI